MSDLDLAVETPTMDFVSALQSGNFNDAEELFKDILGDKVQQSLDAEKVSVADQMFNGVEPVELETEMDDEEVDAILDTVSEDE
jgi:hypothetical protein|tara:strand:+ start:670 stop:921 length:252 start_codon:yes stop_codon:yes gene_type:complete